jgi:hypothetical protein
LPTTVWMMPVRTVILRIRSFLESTTYTLPALSRATSRGSSKLASVARPPSPKNPPPADGSSCRHYKQVGIVECSLQRFPVVGRIRLPSDAMIVPTRMPTWQHETVARWASLVVVGQKCSHWSIAGKQRKIRAPLERLPFLHKLQWLALL